MHIVAFVRQVGRIIMSTILWFVAQTGSPLCRRLATGGPPESIHRSFAQLPLL